MKSTLLSTGAAALVMGAAGGAPVASHAEVLVHGLGKTVCATVYNNRLQLNKCNAGDAQNWFNTRSPVQHYHNLCLGTDANHAADAQHPRAYSVGGAQLVVEACDATKPSQRWALRVNGLFGNDSGWCMDTNGGSVSEGTRIQIWTCSSGNPVVYHQLWAPGDLSSGSALRLGHAGMLLGPGSVAALSWAQTASGGLPQLAANPGNMLTRNGSILSQGVSNIVAQGGGNIVAQGGGNIVAQGGGNAIALSGGMIVAQGGGN